MRVAIYCEPRVEWQGPFAQKMAEGLANIGLEPWITQSREPTLDVCVILGTTFFKRVEAQQGLKWLLVDRCSFGDTTENVSLVWNGHGRRGNHCAPDNPNSDRWDQLGGVLWPVREMGKRHILCGQQSTYSPHWERPEDWYNALETSATHFRPHPTCDNPTKLPNAITWWDVACAIVLNSSVGVETLLSGIQTDTWDEGGMSYAVDVNSRQDWVNWLAWTQWHHEEIRNGESIAHLFDHVR